jgi:hypothetical protein
MLGQPADMLVSPGFPVVTVDRCRQSCLFSKIRHFQFQQDRFDVGTHVPDSVEKDQRTGIEAGEL